MNSTKKAYISFLMSVFLMSSIAALAYIGVFDFKNFPAMPNSVKIIAFAAVFFTLFLLIFFLFNLRRSFSKKKKTAAAAATAVAATVVAAATEIADAPADVTRHQGGLLAAASQRYDLSSSDRIDETSGHDIIYEENGVPYINSDLARKNNQGTLNNNFIKLVESVCLPPPVPRQQDKP